MKVKCIKAAEDLTLGKIYQVLAIESSPSGNRYYVMDEFHLDDDDFFYPIPHAAYYFERLTAEIPCDYLVSSSRSVGLLICPKEWSYKPDQELCDALYDGDKDAIVVLKSLLARL